VIGRELVPLLVNAGFDVAAMTRSSEKAPGLEAAGAQPVVCDVFDRERLIAALTRFGPEIVVHELTDLPDDAAQIPELAERNIRIRREGTRNLIDAAREARASRFLAQSVAWELRGESGAASRDLEQMVLEIDGVVLRYGQFYGPGTYHATKPASGPAIEVAEAAHRTIDLIDAASGIYEITDSGDTPTQTGK
jgi:uncharacterized protein YbjT (DUF2867 family)